jgi:hypothetical protein
MSKTLRNLQVAREQITPPSGWCQELRWLWRDTPQRWANCALGAIEFSLGVKKYSLIESPEVDALVATIPAAWSKKNLIRVSTLPTHKVAMYNNANDHKTVLAWFDQAIARQKQVDEMLVVEAAQPELCDA